MKQEEKSLSYPSLLAGDLGGTKTSLALFNLTSKRPDPYLIETFASKNASSFVEILETFLSRHPRKIVSACFGVAGPVSKGHARITNLPWSVSENELKELFSWEWVHLINDLVATTLSIPVLEAHELAELNQGSPDPSGVIGVLAPGTGLGMALMLFINGEPYPIQSEGGHVDFAPKNSIELSMLQDLMGDHVSVERLVSGPGLFTIYSWLKDYRKHKEPGWLKEKLARSDASRVISEVAVMGKDPVCVETLDMFISILGATAGNIALTGLTTGGIFLAGGICPKILSKLKQGHFIKAFTAKGRFGEFLSRIPVKVILNDKAALLGAACCAMRPMEK
ncbi:MAG: glucokinase [Desulfomonilaceae bacterium]